MIRLCTLLLLLNNLPHQTDHFARFGVTVVLELGIDQTIAYFDLKLASVRWDQGQAFELVLEFLEQFICQAHGPVGVVSYGAVDDFDSGHWFVLSEGLAAERGVEACIFTATPPFDCAPRPRLK
jgi:hypothetical protein